MEKIENKKPKESIDLVYFQSIKVINDDDSKKLKKLRQHHDKAFKIRYLVVKKKKGEQQMSSDEAENDHDEDELGLNSESSHQNSSQVNTS